MFRIKYLFYDYISISNDFIIRSCYQKIFVNFDIEKATLIYSILPTKLIFKRNVIMKKRYSIILLLLGNVCLCLGEVYG